MSYFNAYSLARVGPPGPTAEPGASARVRAMPHWEPRPEGGGSWVEASVTVLSEAQSFHGQTSEDEQIRILGENRVASTLGGGVQVERGILAAPGGAESQLVAQVCADRRRVILVAPGQEAPVRPPAFFGIRKAVPECVAVAFIAAQVGAAHVFVQDRVHSLPDQRLDGQIQDLQRALSLQCGIRCDRVVLRSTPGCGRC